jgi:hypothetical protein
MAADADRCEPVSVHNSQVSGEIWISGHIAILKVLKQAITDDFSLNIPKHLNRETMVKNRVSPGGNWPHSLAARYTRLKIHSFK